MWKSIERLTLPCLAAILILAGCVSTPEEASAPPDSTFEPVLSDSNYQQAGLLAETIEFLHHNYADQDNAGYDRLLTAALRGMMRELDPYSGYEPPAVYKENQTARTGERIGIGVEMVKPNNLPPAVVMTIPDSPAVRGGIIPGDRILRIDGQRTAALPLRKCMELLQGPEGSRVRLELLPLHSNKTRQIELPRGKVVQSSVPSQTARLIDGDIGYLKIDNFNAHTPAETAAQLAKLRKEGMSRGLILDLRNNPGGLVGGAGGTASLFLPKGAELFTAVHRNMAHREVARASGGKGKELTLPIVILTNPFTASAAELFSGALRDNARAKLVGMRSFGKGTLLRVLQLKNGGALRYAAGYYRTPKGVVIERHGLAPDVPVELTLPQLWRLNRQLLQHPGVVQPEGGDMVRDTQLEAALKQFPSRKSKPEKAAPKQ